MTEPDLTKLEKLLAEATAGPWEWDHDRPKNYDLTWLSGPDETVIHMYGRPDGKRPVPSTANRELIVALRNAGEELIAKARSLATATAKLEAGDRLAEAVKSDLKHAVVFRQQIESGFTPDFVGVKKCNEEVAAALATYEAILHPQGTR